MPATFTPAARQWLISDLDGLPCPPWVSPVDPEQVGGYARRLMPAPFHPARAYVALSSGAGLKPGIIKVHLAHWLDRAIDQAEATALLSSVPGFDPAILRCVQLNYCAAPVVDDDALDPIPGERSCILPGLPEVELSAATYQQAPHPRSPAHHQNGHAARPSHHQNGHAVRPGASPRPSPSRALAMSPGTSSGICGAWHAPRKGNATRLAPPSPRTCCPSRRPAWSIRARSRRRSRASCKASASTAGTAATCKRSTEFWNGPGKSSRPRRSVMDNNEPIDFGSIEPDPAYVGLSDYQQEILALAALPQHEYDRVRKATAKRLEVRLPTLDADRKSPSAPTVATKAKADRSRCRRSSCGPSRLTAAS